MSKNSILPFCRDCLININLSDFNGTLMWVDVSMKSNLLPFLDEKLRGYIPLRPIVSTRQKSHYHR